MTELDGQSRVEQLNDIIESVEKCEEQMNTLMERLKWTKEKLPKPKNKKKNVSEIVEASEMERNDAVTNEAELVRHLEPSESVSGFPEFGDRNKLDSSSCADLNKLKRDLRRRRVKHRVTKTAPLTYTEEIRELIAIQMDIEENRHKKCTK